MHQTESQSITQAKNRSINTIIKNKRNRSKEYCMFYNKFGKSTKMETGFCPFMYDKNKVAVCRRFLQGSLGGSRSVLKHSAIRIHFKQLTEISIVYFSFLHSH